MNKVTREAVDRFISKNLHNPDPDIAAGAELLRALVANIKNGKSADRLLRDTLKLRKVRTVIFRPEDCPAKDPAVPVMLDYVTGRVSYTEAVRRFGQVHPASDRAIEGWIAALRDDARGIEQAARALDRLLLDYARGVEQSARALDRLIAAKKPS